MIRLIATAAALILLAVGLHTKAFAGPTPGETAIASPTPPATATAPAYIATPVPTARPDQIVFYGQVPAPAGTKVTIRFPDISDPNPANWETITCGSAATSPDPGGDANVSNFFFAVDASCTRTGLGVSFSWGDGLGALLDFWSSEGGHSYNVGLLHSPAIGTPTPIVGVPAVGGGGERVTLPKTGSHSASSGDTTFAAVVVLLFASGFVCVGLAAGLRRRG